MALSRKDVPANRKWDLSVIFASEAEWDALYEETAKAIDFAAYQGKLSDENTLFECLEKINAVSLNLNKLAVYAFMRRDEDTRNSAATALVARVDNLEMQFAGAISFVTPELTGLSKKKLTELSRNPRFADYDYTLRGIIKQKPHVRSAEIEELLAKESKVFSGYQQVFTMLNNADFPAPTITVDGKKTTVSHGMYGLLLNSPDRKVRKAAFQAYYKAFIGLIHTITATYVGNVEKDVFRAKVRNYESSLDMALAQEDVDKRVYENLLESVGEGLPLLHRYYKDRKKIMGLRELHMYDIYPAIVENAEIKVDYEQAFDIVKEGLAPLGEEYQALLQQAHDNGWIDVEETEGKRSGAYSISVHGLPHPYVLLNYQPTTNNVFTLAHELGHAMHSYHSERSQPQEKSSYRIFVAEVASTVNEILLLKHLLKTTEDANLKKYLLSYYIDTLKGTLFRQTQFAEFEYISHDMAEKGQPLTTDALNQVYLELNKKYYGPAVVSDPEIAYEWARIPHLYRCFYVYKYATGIISAISIAERIEKEGACAVADYFKFLSSGGSDSPVELLKLAGVDLTKKDAFKAAMASFEAALNEFEALM